ncbi:zinc finger protein ZAT5-like protein [Tanacetum coccineum]
MEFLPKSTAETSRSQAQQIITGKCMDHPRPCSSSYNVGSEEEEDMANCLIMLAQSVSPTKQSNSDLNSQNTEKLKHPSLSNISYDSYKYECKTCNRFFHSFQALGGHRTSHKKPKLAAEEDRNSASIKTEYFIKDQPKLIVEEHMENKIITTNKSPFPPPGFIQTGCKTNKAKVHECSICGSEFFSGQALGGHMRRHRAVPPSTNQIVVSTSMNATSAQYTSEKSPMLSLDLNLPAPEAVVDDVHSNFQFPSASSQQHLAFPAAALNTSAGEKKTLKKPSQTSRGVPKGVEHTIEVSNSDLFDVLNSGDNNGEFGTNGETNNLVNNEATSSGSSFMNIDNDGELLDNDGNPLVPTGIVESDSEVELVFDETANLKIPTSGKDRSDKGYGTNSLLEQWRDSYPDNDDYDPYDDDMYENHDLSEHLQSIYDDLDITVRGRKKK